VVAVAIVLPGCGSGGVTSTAAAPAQTRAQAKTASGAPCPSQVTAFVRALDVLRKQLAVGLSYDQYAARVKALGASYGKLPIERLDLACLAASGTAGERSFNKYIDAANAWGECLADASCGTATIEPVLQRKWRLASHSLSEAR
jgi:hypothetical protein